MRSHEHKDAATEVDLKFGTSTLPGITNISYRPMNSAMPSWTSYNGLVNTIAYDSDLRPTGIRRIKGQVHFPRAVSALV